MDWGGANSRFLGLVSVWAARSFDQTALRPSVIKRIRQIDVKYITQASVSLREHACVSSRGAQSTELVSLYIGYWTLNNYYYYYKNHYVFLLGDFNVFLSPDIEITAAVEEFKNLFCSHHLFPLINKPTRETK